MAGSPPLSLRSQYAALAPLRESRLAAHMLIKGGCGGPPRVTATRQLGFLFPFTSCRAALKKNFGRIRVLTLPAALMMSMTNNTPLIHIEVLGSSFRLELLSAPPEILSYAARRACRTLSLEGWFFDAEIAPATRGAIDIQLRGSGLSEYQAALRIGTSVSRVAAQVLSLDRPVEFSVSGG